MLSVEIPDFVAGVSGSPQSGTLQKTNGAASAGCSSASEAMVLDNKQRLSKSSFIKVDLEKGDFFDKAKLQEHAESSWPMTASMLSIFESRAGANCTDNTKMEKTQKSTPASTAYNQSRTSENKMIKSFLDQSSVNFENSIGMMNKQQYFGEHDRELMTTGFLLEDELQARLHALAKMTCGVVDDDDQEEDDQFEDILGRANPQKQQLHQFCKMVDGDMDFYDGDIPVTEVEDALDLDDSHYQSGDELEIELKADAFTKLSPFFKDKALRSQEIVQLKKCLQFHISPSVQRNTTFYMDMKSSTSKLDPPEARLSYKYYTGRFPEITGAAGEALNNDKMLYNNKSIHYKELHFFDDMIKKINDEKEMWPGIKITDTNTNQEQVNSQSRKDKDPDGASTSGRSPPGFSPPFGSF